MISLIYLCLCVKGVKNLHRIMVDFLRIMSIFKIDEKSDTIALSLKTYVSNY